MIPLLVARIGVGGREWYENDTISVSKTGINGIISEIGIGSLEDTTIIVNSGGIIGTTTDV